MTGYDVRRATETDLPLLAEIEGAADEMFASVFGDVEPKPPRDGSDRAVVPGFVLVAGSPPVGFVHVEEDGQGAHLEQLAVHPEAMGRGIGTSLLEGACQEASDQGHQELTLTTYADIPWNAPFYARRGFAVVDEPSASGRDRMAVERSLGLERHGRRVFMTRPLRPTSGERTGGSTGPSTGE